MANGNNAFTELSKVTRMLLNVVVVHTTKLGYDFGNLNREGEKIIKKSANSEQLNQKSSDENTSNRDDESRDSDFEIHTSI